MRRALNEFSKRLCNLLYVVPWAVHRFRRKYPDEEVLVAGAAKGVITDGELVGCADCQG